MRDNDTEAINLCEELAETVESAALIEARDAASEFDFMTAADKIEALLNTL